MTPDERSPFEVKETRWGDLKIGDQVWFHTTSSGAGCYTRTITRREPWTMTRILPGGMVRLTFLDGHVQSAYETALCEQYTPALNEAQVASLYRCLNEALQNWEAAEGKRAEPPVGGWLPDEEDYYAEGFVEALMNWCIG